MHFRCSVPVSSHSRFRCFPLLLLVLGSCLTPKAFCKSKPADIPGPADQVIYDYFDKTFKLVEPSTASPRDIGRALTDSTYTATKLIPLRGRSSAAPNSTIRVSVANINFAKFKVAIEDKDVTPSNPVPDLLAKFFTPQSNKTSGGTGASVINTDTPFGDSLSKFNNTLRAYLEKWQDLQQGVARAAQSDTYTELSRNMPTSAPEASDASDRRRVNTAFEDLRAAYYSSTDTGNDRLVQTFAFERATTEYNDFKTVADKVSDAIDVYDQFKTNDLFAKSFISSNPKVVQFSGGARDITVTITPNGGTAESPATLHIEESNSSRLTSDFSTGVILPKKKDLSYGVSNGLAVRSGEDSVTVPTQFVHGLYNFTSELAAGLSVGIGARDADRIALAWGGTICLRFHAVGKTLPMYFTYGTALVPLNRLNGLKENDPFTGDSVPTTSRRTKSGFFGVSMRL